MVFFAGLAQGLVAGEFNETLYRQYLDKYMQEMKATKQRPHSISPSLLRYTGKRSLSRNT
ncbi:MAG: hypothetical protein D6820_04950 [Lentisphaerae bacterium]|nr:MAG: hypothetical protein D6820_04950 [Lentisphaerota bacterium]